MHYTAREMKNWCILPSPLEHFRLVLEEKEVCDFKGRCVFLYLLTHSRSRYLREPAPHYM
jgi:hypothetical protein